MARLKVYLVERSDRPDYDEYAGFVVVARSPKDALGFHPDGNERSDAVSYWVTTPGAIASCTLVGYAAPRAKRGVLLADFRAG